MSPLTNFWLDMGFIRYPLAFTVIVIAGLGLWSTAALFKPGAWADLRTKALVDAVLFWGGFAVITGMVGTLVGIVVGAQAVEAAGEVSTTLVWGGIKVALISSIVGALILAASSLIWFGLQLRWRMLEADEADA
jgi:hypothetical protein